MRRMLLLLFIDRNFRLFVEELKLHHPGFATVSIDERERVKEVRVNC